jgi:hypothetical protein
MMMGHHKQKPQGASRKKLLPAFRRLSALTGDNEFDCTILFFVLIQENVIDHVCPPLWICFTSLRWTQWRWAKILSVAFA